MKRKSARSGSGGLVYSSEHGRICDGCGWPADRCSCSKASSPHGTQLAGKGVRVGRRTKGRKGNGVTVIEGLGLAGDALAALAKDLKKKCGSGGSVRDGVIEIQGEHRDRLVAELRARGFDAKRAGG
jgi:translation initiation factor 1